MKKKLKRHLKVTFFGTTDQMINIICKNCKNDLDGSF